MKRSRIKPRRSKPRRGPLRDPGYMDWLRDRKCLACWQSGMTTYSVGCHTVNNGRGSKGPDSSCIPLCDHHHAEMDGRLSTKITTKRAFAEKYDLDLAQEAAAHYALYRESLQGTL